MERPKVDAFITLYQNPSMAELVIESINEARKPRDMCLWGFFEHGFDPDLEPIFDKLEGIETKKVMREKKYGINWNTPSAFKQLGEETEGEYVTCLQSDIVISKDFFEFIDHGFAHHQVGYVFALAYPNGVDNASVVAVECHPGWYGHWGVGVRKEVICEYYIKYLTDEYATDPDAHAKKFFPTIKCGGSDYFIARFLAENNVSGIRPACSRVTNIGIHGEHIRLKGKAKTSWDKMSHEERIAVLRTIIDSGKYTMESNYDLSVVPRVKRDYSWHEFQIVKDTVLGGKYTGTDL